MGSLSILNNIPALEAQNELGMTQMNLNQTLTALSSGQRINTGADDPAGLAIANGLEANITALTQSVQNATDGVGELQVADGALSQITALLNSAVSLATESANGTVSDQQRTALQAEFASIQTEINSIGGNTTYNGQAIFNGATTIIYMSDSSGAGVNTVTINFGTVNSSNLGVVGATTISIAGDNLSSATSAQAALTDLNNAIQGIAGLRGNLGADSNQLSSAVNVMNVQITNLTSAEDGIMAANIGTETSNLSKFSILQQTGIAALQQANSLQQSVLKLLQ
ncbi:MAG TPA: flagellin [Terriglobales bacterium]|jgi:flagellin|nr:flagellin [Terriglobales bacterium]